MKILILVLIAAVIVDMQSFRIPNLCIIVGVTAGIVYNLYEQGTQGVMQSLLQITVLFLVLYPFYLLGGIGAGDIKLWMMTGWYMQGKTWIYSMIISLLLAGAVAIIKLIYYQENRKRLGYTLGYIKKVCLTGVIDDYMPGVKEKHCVIRLSVPILCSVLLQYGGFYS